MVTTFAIGVSEAISRLAVGNAEEEDFPQQQCGAELRARIPKLFP